MWSLINHTDFFAKMIAVLVYDILDETEGIVNDTLLKHSHFITVTNMHINILICLH